MLQILGTPGYTCNYLRLLLQNSFDDLKLPVRVENRTCSHGFKDFVNSDQEFLTQFVVSELLGSRRLHSKTFMKGEGLFLTGETMSIGT